MKTFTYKITDSNGIHARPAGLLIKKASEFKSAVMLNKDSKSADAKKIFSVMSLGAKCGDSITITVDGDDEDFATEEIKNFFEENL